jgi:hypothetical protein
MHENYDSTDAMNDLAKRQEAEMHHYCQTVCVKCPTKNCGKKKGETNKEYEQRQSMTSLIACCHIAEDCIILAHKEPTWEDCDWNKYGGNNEHKR